MVDIDIVKAAQAYAKEKHAEKKETDIFHGWNHTQAVVAAAEKIAHEAMLNPEERQILLLAAWLHETGATTKKNIEASVATAADFLTAQGLPPAEIRQVVHCIRASQDPPNPQNNVEEVFCDALTSLLATDDYSNQITLYTAQLSDHNSEKADWLKKQRTLVNDRIFYTNYARQTYSGSKEKNADFLKRMRKQIEQDQEKQEEARKEIKKVKKDEDKDKEQKASKGIETLFRTTMASHMQLSIMADNKANLMISINAIIASIMVSSFLRKFEEVPQLMIPTLCLTLVCILTIVFAVMATRPNIKTRFVKQEKIDMLFFGDFTQLSPTHYKDGIREIMYNNDLLYDSMIDNIYLQGKVLTKKYRLLKVAYTIFMFGFAFVILSYAAALLLFPTAE